MSKPKLWEDQYLSSAVNLTLQIVENLESASKNSGVPLYELPDSVINSELLYHIATCYNTLYETLLDQDLKLYGNKLNILNQQLN